MKTNKLDRLDKIILAFWLSLVVGGLAFAALGCDHGGDAPYTIAFCAPSDGVAPCPGFPTKDTLDGLHAVQVECADLDADLSCQVDTGATYAYAACSKCGAQWKYADVRDTADPAALANAGVRLCGPLSYRSGAYCAVCDDAALSMQFGYSPPSSGGFSSSVACVRDCSVCAVVPQ